MKNKNIAQMVQADYNSKSQGDGPILLFDGVCNLCNFSVQWIIRHDPEGIFRFASLQSETGKLLLNKCGLQPDAINTVVLVKGNTANIRSNAILKVFEILGGKWAWLAILRVVPCSIRDAGYEWLARHRYNWFGRKNTCMVPTPEQKDRFI